MDEPWPNLDAKLRVQMRSEVLRVHRRIGVPALYVTHDQTEAMTMRDRVAVLRASVLQQISAPRELRESPANMFVATFIGSPSMNLYEAHLESDDQAERCSFWEVRSCRFPTPALKRNPGLSSYLGRDVLVGIRPEHLSDPAHSGAAPEPGTALSADVDYIEVLGSEQLVHFAIDARRVREETQQADADQGEIVAASVAEGVARNDPRSAIRSGGRVVFGLDVERLHFFDPAMAVTIAPPSAPAPAAEPTPSGAVGSPG